MGAKINLDEEFIVNEYLNGKSSLMLEKELNVSKFTILKILNNYQVIKKRDRCKSLNIVENEDKYITYRTCPNCGEKIKVSSNNKSITCRNYFNAVNKQSLCKKCGIESQKGEGNPFYGKKHSDESKQKISNSRVGKATGERNSMANPKWRQKVSINLKKKWDNGDMEHARKIMSDKLKETRKLDKIKSIIRSKKEDEIILEIQNLGYDVIPSLRIETKICDVYIPKLNLIIEYNGDYWHCNPKKYKPDYYHQVKQATAKELWEYDKNKIDLIKKSGYNLEIVWESDLKSDPTIINKLIKKYDK